MEGKNYSLVTEFILVGFMDHPELQIPLFMLFLGIYIVTLIGNLGMIILIQISTRLQTPMYFFLSNLSLVDFCHSSVIAPKLLQTFVVEKRTISFIGCSVQWYFVCMLLTHEICLLAVMAYDRFVAICSPLLYSTIMSKKLCIFLVIISYITGFVNATTQNIYIFSLSFCGSNVINHFFCDFPPILKLSCSDSHKTDIVHFTFSTIVLLTTITFILISYLAIITTILKMRSAGGRCKAFSTCASHLITVTILYGTLSFMYLRPTSGYTMGQDKIISVLYTLVIPMLNPLIYSLRNKDVKEALKRIIDRKIFS